MNITRREALFLSTAALSRAADHPLAAEWQKIAGEMDGVAGAAALHIPSGERVAVRGDDHFPLASVCKLPIAMQMFALVAEGKFSLKQAIDIPAEDVVKNVSPIGERWAKRKKWPLDEMVELMIAKSDNTAVQTFFRLGGGGEGITARLRGWGIGGVRIDRDERTIGKFAAQDMRRFADDPRDSGTPNSTVDLLHKALYGKILRDDLTKILRADLEKTTTGMGRIPALLPKGTVVGRKTGTFAGSANDVGVIRLPKGGELAVAFYTKASTRDLPVREKVIARMAKAAYDWAVALG
jgi:beta-lactamase class A